MKMFRNISLIFLFTLQLFVLPAMVLAQEAADIPVTVFVRESCKHCHDAKEFLDGLPQKEINVQYLDLSESKNNTAFETVTEMVDFPKVTPVILIGDVIIQGFDTAETTGESIKEIIKRSSERNFYSLEYILENKPQLETAEEVWETCSENSLECEVPEEAVSEISLPFGLGTINTKNFTLTTLSMVLGLIDGFNPCAMWVLVTFLIVLIKVGDRKKMFQIAGIFIIAEAIMYYLILNVWYTTINFVQFAEVITPIIGTIAVGAGIFFLYEFWTSDGTCKVTNLKQRSKISKRIKDLASNPMTWLSFFAIIALAFSVNIIEFVCSIGIPQTFSKVLQLNGVSELAKQGYMLLYILFYMIDDFIVFGIALYGIDKLASTQKYTKMSNLLGGIILIILGLLLMISPESLVF